MAPDHTRPDIPPGRAWLSSLLARLSCTQSVVASSFSSHLQTRLASLLVGNPPVSRGTRPALFPFVGGAAPSAIHEAGNARPSAIHRRAMYFPLTSSVAQKHELSVNWQSQISHDHATSRHDAARNNAALSGSTRPIGL